MARKPPRTRPEPRIRPDRESAESEAVRTMLSHPGDPGEFVFGRSVGTAEERTYCVKHGCWHWAKHQR